MNLASVVKAIRNEAKSGPNDSESRAEWQNRLVAAGDGLLDSGRLYRAAARQWLADQVRNVTADILKRPGSMPRVAAGQVAVWPDMEPVAGRAALRAYARKYHNVVFRYALVVRLLGYLDMTFGDNEKALESAKTLFGALSRAGASEEDLALLQEVVAVSKAA